MRGAARRGAEHWTNYVIYFSHVSGSATASRCWAKVNTVLAKHTPLLTSLPWLSLGQAPVSSTIKCSQLRSSSDTTPRKYVGNINKPLQIVFICTAIVKLLLTMYNIHWMTESISNIHTWAWRNKYKSTECWRGMIALLSCSVSGWSDAHYPVD